MKWHERQDQVVPPLLHGLRNETDYIQEMGCGESLPTKNETYHEYQAIQISNVNYPED